MRGRYAVEYFDEICRKRANAPRDRQVSLRVRAATVNGTSKRTPQLLVKVVGWSKSAGSAGRLASYVGRRSGEKLDIPLETSEGKTVSTRDELRTELDGWGILSNGDNRSKAWERATTEERAAMSEKDALRYRQSLHMVVSLPVDLAAHKPELQAAVRDTLAETFGAAGHKYMMAVHDHNGRSHVHIVAQVRSEPDDVGKRAQLRLGRDELDALRVKMADHLQRNGVEIAATRRADRPEIRAGRDAVQQKQQPWMSYTGGYDALPQKYQKQADQSFREWAAENPRPAAKYGKHGYVDYVQERERERGTGGLTPPGPGAASVAASFIARKAPEWYKAFGAELERRRAGDPEPQQQDPQANQRPAGWFGRFRSALSPAQQTAEPDSQVKGWFGRLADRLPRSLRPTETARAQAPATTAAAPAQGARTKAPQSRTPAWTRKQQGYDALTPAEQGRAAQAYAGWAAENPDKARRYDMRSYVAWVQEQEASAGQRRAAERQNAAQAKRVDARARGAQQRLAAVCDAVYGTQRAGRAAALFDAMYRENPGSAVWTLNNRPEAFGAVVGKSPIRFTGRGYSPSAAGPLPPSQGAPTPEQQARAAAAVARRRTEYQRGILDRSATALAGKLETAMPWDPAAQSAAATLRAETRKTPARDKRTQDRAQAQEKPPAITPNRGGREAWEQRPQRQTVKPQTQQKTRGGRQTDRDNDRTR